MSLLHVPVQAVRPKELLIRLILGDLIGSRVTRVVGQLARREPLSRRNAWVDREIFGFELEDARRGADQNG